MGSLFYCSLAAICTIRPNDVALRRTQRALRRGSQRRSQIRDCSSWGAETVPEWLSSAVLCLAIKLGLPATFPSDIQGSSGAFSMAI